MLNFKAFANPIFSSMASECLSSWKSIADSTDEPAQNGGTVHMLGIHGNGIGWCRATPKGSIEEKPPSE